MPHILRRPEQAADPWVCLGEQSAADALIVTLAQLRAEEARWRAWPGRLGVRLTPGDAPEELGAWLARLALIAVEFPNPGDGRGYSQARLLRGRLGFSGELRAVGSGVKQDQVFLLARCGFDVLELAPGEDPQAARRALGRYTVAYQPGADTVPLERQRFRTP